MLPASLEVVHGADQAAFLLEPTRRRILSELAEPASASALARRLGLPRQRVNYHLRELERVGCVELVEERRKGNCTERVVRATARAFLLSPAALGDTTLGLGEVADAGSAAFLVATAARTVREVGELTGRARREQKRLATLTLDTTLRFASADDRAAFAAELTAALASLSARYHAADAVAGRDFRLTTFLHPAATAPESTRGADHEP